MNNTNILLDIDGVLAEWIVNCCHLFNADPNEIMSKWKPGKRDLEHALGITSKELWEKVDKAGEDYWANLPETPWARKLYDECNKLGDVYFITKPSYDPRSLSGKLIWITKFTKNNKFDKYLIGKPKQLCSQKGNILIDDNDINVKDFRKCNGTAILFPRIWNEHYNMYKYWKNDVYLFVLDELKKLL